ncbi:hypothetical protein NHP200010_14910 [Helicobacter bizzozeronii]|nr:hypothetical protein NHP200010_14910 [Helicobacter bizzozeronii]
MLEKFDGASSISKSSGTATEPPDLQIDTPPNCDGGLNPKSKDGTCQLKIEANLTF